jgi:hypothetical protein
MFWDLLLHRYRKKKLLDTLALWVDAVFLSKTTYLSYYDFSNFGTSYARQALCITVSVIVQEEYATKGVGDEFFSSGMSKRINDYFTALVHLGTYKGNHHPQVVFIAEQGVEATDIAFLVGDALLCDMSKEETQRFILTDLLFDVYCKKGNPDVPTKIFGTEKYSMSIIRLNI